MKKATENLGTTRTFAENLSPGKVMSPVQQQLSLPHFTFPQETPMKPSQVHNLLSHPSLRRVVPLQTLYIPSSNDFPINPKDRVGPPKHFAQPPGCVPSNPANSGTSAHMLHPERLGPQQGTGQSRPRHISSSQLFPASPTSNNISFDRPSFPSVFNSPSSQSVRNFNSHTPPSHSRSDKETESKVSSSISGSNNEKSQQHERVPSRENFIPAMDLNCTSQKRQREFESCYENTKKPCLQDANPGSIQTVTFTPCNSPSTSLVAQPSLKNSSILELSPKTTDDLLLSELAYGQSTSTLKTAESHITLSSKDCLKNSPSTGAKQMYSVNISGNLVRLSLPLRHSEESAKKENEKKHTSEKPSSSKFPQKDICRPRHVGSASHYSDHTSGSRVVLSAKTQIRRNQIGKGRKLHGSISKPSSKSLGSQSGCTAERSKTSRVRRPVPDDIDQLFTPDPIVSPTCKIAKPKIKEGILKSPTSEKCVSPPPGCVPPVTTSSCHMTPQSKVTEPLQTMSSSAKNLPVSLPTVTLKRVKLEKLHLCSKNKSHNNSPIPSSEMQLKDKTFQFHRKQSPSSSISLSSCAFEMDTAASKQTPSPNCTQSLSPERQQSEGSRMEEIEEDLTDMELDLDLSIAYGIVETQSSDSSKEEELVSFQEMMAPVTKLPDTPEKGAFSEPSTPGHRSSQSKTQLLSSTTKTVVYKNSLDQMLKEINDNKRAKETEAQLLMSCKEDLLRLAEYEESEENQEEVSSEQQEFLQRYSLMSVAIREVPPGEMVFNLEKFGRIFDQHTLQLRKCKVNPQGTTQKTLIWSSPSQLRLHVNIGLFQEAYGCSSPCPTQVTRFLFKMMSVHKERMVSEKILQALCDIASSAAYQTVNSGSQQFEVWVPSLADVTLVLMNMGAAFVTLFAFGNLQPSFTEGDLLEDMSITSESPSSNGEEMIFPDHNLSNVLKYLSYCMGLCPRAYSDDELLLLLTVVGRISLETQWILQSRVEVCCVQYKIINNIRDWNTMLPRICQALTNLTDDHHNMCLLVQLLPDSTRGKNLCQHLSMSLISKLLDGTCTYRPTSENFQLADLRLYLPQMQPSVLLQTMHQKDKEEDMVTLDQQAYYLCYSLLTLTNQASNFHIFPRRQKAQLLALSSELETHIKCDIRESEKCLYRSKVKDLLARIYTKWQMLLRKIRPLNGKLYDYWQPVDTFRGSQDEEEEEEDETTLTNESDVTVTEYEEEEERKKMEETEEDQDLHEMLGDDETDGTKDTSRTEEASEEEEVTQTMPRAVDEQMDTCMTEQTDVENETSRTKCHI